VTFRESHLLDCPFIPRRSLHNRSTRIRLEIIVRGRESVGFIFGLMANNWFSHVGVADVLAKVPNTPHKVTYLSPTRKAIALRIDSMRVQISKNKITFSIGGYNRLFLPLRSRVVVVGVQMARKLNFYGPGDRFWRTQRALVRLELARRAFSNVR